MASLSKKYRLRPYSQSMVTALADVSFSVASGEIFGLLGPNGAGKTTFVKILLSIVRPSSGAATIFGKPHTERAVRSRIGYLPENHRFPSFLTGLDTLLYFGGMHGLRGTQLRQKSLDLMKLVGLQDWKHARIRKYSKGMLQRLGLAQALLSNPDVLFLDEPTDGVDPIGRREIRDLLKTFRDQGKTIFLNSHILSEVESLCDRVAILHKGSLLKVGTVGSITARSLEYELRTALPPSADVLSILRSATPSAGMTATGYTFSVQDVGHLNRAVDLLRARSVAIESIVPLRNTLEDSFIKLIKDERTP
ncbi:MAG: ABC transporter ATP-binding protein [Bacteroidota bacterium]